MATHLEEHSKFPNCPTCPYLQTGTAETCHRCAHATFERVRCPCPTCTREMGDLASGCGNPLCNDIRRSIRRIDAIAVKSGPVDRKIKRLKYEAKTGWAAIFGRLVLGHLQTHRSPDDFDLIIANPTFVGPGSPRTIRHTELVLDAARQEDWFDVWPFDDGTPRALVKTGPTPRSAAPGANYKRKVAAADALVDVLEVPDRTKTQGARVLVYDDVCTTGLQLDRVARVLREVGGASHVEGLVLARTPYRAR